MAAEFGQRDTAAFLSPSDFQLLKKKVLRDPYIFAKYIGGFDLISKESHRPLAYLVSGCADLLAKVLCDPEERSYVVSQIRLECHRLGIKYWTPEGVQKLNESCEQINIRIFRGAAKSTVITAASSLWRIANNPNETIAICSKSDENAHTFSQQIIEIIQRPAFSKIFFPELYPAGQENTHLTKGAITLRGRTSPSPQTCIEARGYTSKSWVSTHYRVFYVDDIVGMENRSPQQMKAVSDWLTNMVGLYMPGRVSRIHLGTIWDEQDDDYLLSKNGDFFRLHVPVMRYAKPPENLEEDGEPTMPEWMPLDEIRRRRKATILNELEGPIAWRLNFLLDPTAGGGRIFPAQVVDQQWLEQEKVKKDKDEIIWVMRPKLSETGEPVNHPVTGKPEVVKFNAKKLQTVFGCDQAYSETGDEWGIAVYAEDHDGHGYVLDMRSGQGFDQFRDALLFLHQRWNPVQIALETNAQQELSVTLLKEDKRFLRLRGKMIGIRHGSESKEHRIRNNVAERMKMRKLWMRKNDQTIKAAAEMKMYKPGRHAKDNLLDAISMATVVVRKSSATGDASKRLKQRERLRRIDPMTGIPD